MSTDAITMLCPFSFTRGRAGAKRLRQPSEVPPVTVVPEGRVPRIPRLMALAIHLEGDLQAGKIRDYADIARLGRITRARVTQIMNLLNLAPDVQEEVLFLPRTFAGRDAVTEHDLRPITSDALWESQRQLWEAMKRA